MPLSLSKKSSLFAQSEIRTMMLECARVGGINLAQGVCDTEVPQGNYPLDLIIPFMLATVSDMV